MNQNPLSGARDTLIHRLSAQLRQRGAAPETEGRVEALLGGGFWERFAPLLDGTRVSCAEVLSLCREELAALSPEPEEGWAPFAYRYACARMFPEQGFPARWRRYEPGVLFYLTLLQVLLDAERAILPPDPRWQLDTLGEEELEESAYAGSYRRYLSACRQEYVYEMMRLGLEVTPYRTLEHIAGVHHVALTVARGLKSAGVPVDLALVSAAASGHDLGKFGCRAGERVPYLHYHYTDLWFSRHGMADVGYVAANHSVWDLELDYLPVESLLLIYADFRVKQGRDEQGRETTRISTLEQAFDVILQKLDNVTEEKRARYDFVYAKLWDFQRYMVSLGVDVSLSGAATAPEAVKDVALLDAGEAVERLERLGVDHTVRLMHRLTDRRSFSGLLERARGETDWRKLRAYLGIFQSYSMYLSIPQKTETLDFLYGLLSHREGGIRRQAAALMGEILARFHAGYAKERPADYVPDPEAPTDLSQWKYYLEKCLHPDRRLLDAHRRWISFTLKFTLNSLLSLCEKERRGVFLDAFLSYYTGAEGIDDETAFQLLDTASAMPLTTCTPEQRRRVLAFAEVLSQREDLAVRAAAVLVLGRLIAREEDKARLTSDFGAIACGDSPSLALMIRQAEEILSGAVPASELDEETLSNIFLDNLKTATPWILKEVNIRLLENYGRKNRDQMLHITEHLANLVEVSERVTVRHHAGAALLRLAPYLSVDLRNELAVELAQGLESGEQDRSKYLPEYLGRLCMFLPPAQLEEIIAAMEEYLHSSSASVAAGALDTVGVMYQYYDAYRRRFPESVEAFRRRRERLLGILLKGLAGFREEVRQEAMYVIEHRVFASQTLGNHEKRRAFLLMLKKLLALVSEGPEDDLTFYYRSALLGRLYRFATEQKLRYGGFHFDAPRPVAFFPGTFDPFTLSHKAIAQSIRDLGYEVMLAIDEFSWSKKTQPYRIRRAMAGFSVADEFYIHLFPEDFPVNIANPRDLRALREAFLGREVAVVVGSDVVANASSYRKPPEENSIHGFDHLIIRRGNEGEQDYGAITGKKELLTLPRHLEDVSSTRLRESIDRGRDVSHLVDPVVQGFIYRQGLYLREPQDKPLLTAEDLRFAVLDAPDEGVEMLLGYGEDSRFTPRAFCRELERTGDKLMTLRWGEAGRLLGFISFRCLDSQSLYARLGSTALTGLVRRSAGGRALLISGVYVPRGPFRSLHSQLLLTEVLTGALSREYAYALYCPLIGTPPAYVGEMLALQGFLPVRVPGEERPLFAVDMSCPIVLTHNAGAAVKAPFSSSPLVGDAVAAAHRRLQRTLTEMYPGSLVLSMSAGVIHHRLLQAITERNGVPSVPVEPRVLGEYLCVPFGKLLRGMAVPNTVTKTIHTDKVYQPDLSSYTIEAYPGYSPLPCQVKTIRAFDRPVILVDDMLHDGKRIRCLAPLFREAGAEIRQVLVGYLTGMGRDLMEEMGIPAEGIYYLPNLRMRFTESTLYPFIGGDSLARRRDTVVGMQPGVNRIYPYAAPDIVEDCVDGSAYHLSLCCLENARDILRALESEYRAQYARNLTLRHLGEAVVLPLCPDKGKWVHYDPDLPATYYLDSDIEQLNRLRGQVRIVIQ